MQEKEIIRYAERYLFCRPMSRGYRRWLFEILRMRLERRLPDLADLRAKTKKDRISYDSFQFLLDLATILFRRALLDSGEENEKEG